MPSAFGPGRLARFLVLPVLLALLAGPAHAQWINEIHYDNVGADEGEAVEVVLPSTADPSAFDLYLYNGANGAVYGGSPYNLASFTVGETATGLTVYSLAFPTNGLQNGEPDGLALTQGGALVPGQFLSYEGTFEAADGPAAGETSTDIGVAEGGDTPIGHSLQLTGIGLAYADFVWTGQFGDSFGTVNDGQTFGPPPPARVQVVHNAPDPAAAAVDVWLDEDEEPFASAFAFREASPFVELDPGDHVVTLTAPGDPGTVLLTESVTVAAGRAYQLVAAGVADPGAFEPNPDGADIALALWALPAREASDTDFNVAVRVVHGAPDAPAVDVRTAGEGLFDDLAYGDASEYADVPPEAYVLDVTTADGAAAVGSYAADLAGMEGGALAVFASGFLTPEDDQGGPAFGLLAVLPDGTTFLLEPVVVEERAFEARLGGGSEAVPVPTPASGAVSLTLTGDELVVTGSFAGLVGDYTASHLHLGLAGESGPVEIPLAPTIAGDGRSGAFEAAANTFTLTEGQRAALEEWRLYVNVHSTAYPAGEIRGQVLPASDAYFESRLAGGAEVPFVITRAAGGLALELRGDTLVVTGSFGGLAGDYTASHLHLGLAGESGGVEIPLNAVLDTGERGGLYEAEANTFVLTKEQLLELQSRRLYANVHSTAHPPGEIRGQVLPMSDVYFHGLLLAENEVPTAISGGIGGVAAELADGQLVLSGRFRDLTSAYAASHIHIGGAGEPGSVVIPLNPAVEGDGLSGVFEPESNTFTLTSEQVETLLAEGYYVNVHTALNPPGELRAQLLLAPNNAPDSSAITAPEDGATIVVEGDPGQTLTASWEAAADPDGDRVVYVWQVSPLPDFGLIVFQANAGTETSISLDYGTVDELLEAAEIPVGGSLTGYHRVLASDGSAFAPSTPFSVTITRGVVVDAEDEAALPAAFALGGAYPNPLARAATVRYDLPAEAEVRLEVFDLLGRRVLATAPARVAAGAGRTLRIEAALPAGTYLYRLSAEMAAETATASGRMTVVR